MSTRRNAINRLLNSSDQIQKSVALKKITLEFPKNRDIVHLNQLMHYYKRNQLTVMKIIKKIIKQNQKQINSKKAQFQKSRPIIMEFMVPGIESQRPTIFTK